MSNTNTQPEVQELDSDSLDLVVGGGIIAHEATDDTAGARKQEQSEKLAGEQLAKQ